MLPRSRATAIRSPRTALAVAGPPAPGPLNATVPTGSASISIRLRTPEVRPNGESAGTARGRTEAAIASVPASRGRTASARSLITRPRDRAAAMSPVSTPVIPRAPAARAVGGERAHVGRVDPAAEREPGEDHELVHRVVALDVAGRIGLGVAGGLGVGEDRGVVATLVGHRASGCSSSSR